MLAQASDIIEYKARNGRCKATLIIECDICSKRFRYQSDMKNHYESHFRPRGRSEHFHTMLIANFLGFGLKVFLSYFLQ